MSLSNKGGPWYVIDSEILLKQSCSETQFSGIKSEEGTKIPPPLGAGEGCGREEKTLQNSLQDILSSYLYPRNIFPPGQCFRSFKRV